MRPLFKLVEEVAAGRPAPSDVMLSWHCHFVNAQAGVVFVPFTLKIEKGEFTSFPEFSPDGKKLIFSSSYQSKSNYEFNLFTVDWKP